VSTSTHLISYEESLLMPESNLEEVIDGELHTMPPATLDHNFIIELLHELFLRQMPRRCFCLQTTGFLMNRDPLRYRIPDLAIVDRESVQRERRTAVDPYSRTVPELVIEVISPANRKGSRQRLLQNYAEFGVPETLFFYTESRTYESYAGVALVQSAQAGIVSPRTMPEVSIDLDKLWEGTL
jgi:Uma2 family endonuclease